MLLLGDSFHILPSINDQSIDMILSDLPYGITGNKWDREIDFRWFWILTRRILKPEGVIVLTASQPFSSKLVQSNLQMFKHEWIWHKNRPSNFLNAVREPMKQHEHILVFANKKWTYNPQREERTGTEESKKRVKYPIHMNSAQSTNYGNTGNKWKELLPSLRLPSSVQRFDVETGYHPTQKPVELFKYLIKTYSNEGDLILDPFCGSGSVCIAAQQLNRKWIGIEISPEYITIAKKRLIPYIEQQRLDLYATS